MPRPPRILQDEYPYHVSTKTAGRIFAFRDWTYKIIIQVLIEAQKRYDVHIHHFKMMHTHYHMIVTTPSSNLSQFEWYINSQIAKRLNRRMGRKGHLWEKRFHASIVENETYLARCMKYAYRNGVKAGICAKASEDKQYSTFDFYACGKTKEFVVTEACVYLMMGNTPAGRQRYFLATIDEPVSDEEIEAIKNGLRKLFYGSADFIEQMRWKYLVGRAA